MKVLTVGGGGREHAIVDALARSSAKIYAVMRNRNPGIGRIAEEVLYAPETDIDQIVPWAKEKGVELAVVGPEAPLGDGLVDALEDAGIPCASPTKAAAQIEISKEFARNLMDMHAIPGALAYRVFDDPEIAKAYLDDVAHDVVVKPVGLTGGKGVKIMGEHLHSKEDAYQYVKEIIENNVGGVPKAIIEEKAIGEEFTLQCFCDGNIVVPMPAVQDHKRAYEGDKGPNTGGMGSYSQAGGLLPFLLQSEYDAGVEIVKRTVSALKSQGAPFKGFLYGQFMLTKDGPKVIEFNCRFGDPEAMNVLPFLESSFLDICLGIASGTLSAKDVVFTNVSTVCKYVVPEGYGVKSLVGEELQINEAGIADAGAKLFYAAVDEKDGKVYTGTSRSLGIVGMGLTIAEAESSSEKALSHVKGRVHIRHDIGTGEVIARRIQHMDKIRGL